MSFSATEFFETEVSFERVDSLKKDELWEIVEHLGIDVAKPAKKAEIRFAVLQELVRKKLLPKMPESEFAERKPQGLSEIGAQLEFRKLELERELKMKELELQREGMQMQKEKDEREMQMQREQIEKDRELQKEKEEKDRELQLEMKKLELEGKKHASETNSQRGSSLNADVARNIKLVPKFHEKDVEKYFLHFEKIAETMKLNKTIWPLLLQSVLIGKAQEVYSALSVEQSADYDYVKKVIMQAYELVPEAYRQKFRNATKMPHDTHVEFAREKETLFDRWCTSKQVDKSFEKLRQLVLLEEFKRRVSFQIKTHLDEQKVEDLRAAAILADDYALTHKQFFQKYPAGTNKGVSSVSSSKPEKSGSSFSYSGPKPKPDVRESQGDKVGPKLFSGPTCAFCHKKGHTISKCFLRESRERGKGEATQRGAINLIGLKEVPKPNDITGLSTGKMVIGAEPKTGVFDEFLSEGSVSMLDDKGVCKNIVILRDTGAAQSLLLKGVLPLSENSSESNLLVSVVGGSYMSVPLHTINLSSKFVAGPVSVGVVPEIPVPGVNLLLGNDLAGGKVQAIPCDVPRVSRIPVTSEETEVLGQKYPGLFPSCAVTRAMANKAKTKQIDDSDWDNGLSLTDTFVGQLFDDGQFSVPSVDQKQDAKGQVNVPSTNVTLQSTQNQVTVTKDQPKAQRPNDPGGAGGLTEEQSNAKLVLSKDELIKGQKSDPEIGILRDTALTAEAATKVPVCYFMKSGVLMRKWRPADVPADDEWKVNYQVVVPSKYRKEILHMAHSFPLAGHLGVNKTQDRILQHFYWPKLRRDVAKFCKTCHVCQMVGKPNQKVKPAPLQPIPAFEEPFTRVIVDCVGPLPKSRSGNA